MGKTISWCLILCMALLATGLSGWIRDKAEGWTRRKARQTAIYSAFYLVITTVLFFPLTVYQQFFREHQYDLATQTFAEWMRDVLMDLVLSVLILPLLFIPNVSGFMGTMAIRFNDNLLNRCSLAEFY